MNVTARNFRRLTEIIGVKVDLVKNGRKLPVATSGEVATLGPGPLDVVATVNPRMNVLGYFITPDKKDQVLDREETQGGVVYRRTVEILRTNGIRRGVPYPDPKAANGVVRLLHVAGDGGAIMWAISLIAQDGTTFLVYQRMFAEQFYREADNTVRAPTVERVDKWKSTVTLINWWLGENPVQLPPMSEYVPASPVETPESDNPLEGVVEWYALGMQMGSILTKEGSVLVKGDQIITGRPGDPLKFLIAGERVRAGAVVPSQGAFPRAFQGVEVVS